MAISLGDTAARDGSNAAATGLRSAAENRLHAVRGLAPQGRAELTPPMAKPFGTVNFTAAEVQKLRELATAGISMVEAARRLRRSPSTVVRRVRENGPGFGADLHAPQRPLSLQVDLSADAGRTPRMHVCGSL